MEEPRGTGQRVLLIIPPDGLLGCLTALEDYLRDVRCLSPQTVRAYGQDLRAFARFLRDASGRVPDPGQVTKRNVIEWIGSLGGAPNSIRRRVTSLRAFWGFLMLTDQAASDPTRGIPLPRKPRHIPHALTELDLAALLAVADRPWHRAAILLLTGTGLRAGELRDLRLGDVDLAGRVLLVRHGKGDKERTVRLSNRVCEALAEYLPKRIAKRGVDSLFISRSGGGLGRQTLLQAIGYLAFRAGIQDVEAETKHRKRHRVTPHAFRRTFATRLDRGGARMRTIQKLLGHADISTTAMYIEADDTAEREAVEMAFAGEPR